MEMNMVCINTEEYKKLILDNDRLKRELDISIVAEIEAGRKVNELKEKLSNLLDNAIEDSGRYTLYNEVNSYNIDEVKLSKYLTENYLDDVKYILKIRKEKKEESEDEVNE